MRLGNAYSVLVRNPEKNILLGTCGRGREDIKWMLYRTEGGLDWISDKTWAAVKNVMNFGWLHTMQRML